MEHLDYIKRSKKPIKWENQIKLATAAYDSIYKQQHN